MRNLIEDLGINIGLLMAGFLGSLVNLTKKKEFSFRTTLASIIAGMASSNYLTPVVGDLFDITKQNYLYSIAFILGFLGLKGVELISDKIFNKEK